jgi:colanic acid biosynthesis protein WcaH
LGIIVDRETKKLSPNNLIDIVKNAPLVSIDLIIRNDRSQVLLGLRKNEPAKGFWFVPGGRILKNELIAEAFERIAGEELGIGLAYRDSRFLGVFEHLYEENFARKQGFGTHYVVLAHEIKTPETKFKTLENQHSRYKWFDESSIHEARNVHPYTKAYFK